MIYTSFLKKLSKEQITNIVRAIRAGKYQRGYKYPIIAQNFSSMDDFHTFCKWYKKFLKENDVDMSRSVRASDDPTMEVAIEVSLGEVEQKNTKNFVEEPVLDETDNYLHNKEYYYHEESDKYVITIPSKQKPLILPGVYLRSVISAYSNWDGQPATINEMCRKFAMSRRTMIELLRVMGTTHDSSPYTDEVLAKASEEELVIDLLRRKEERVLLQTERKEYRNIQKDAYKYRNYKMFAESIKLVLEDISPIDVSVPKFNKKRDEFSVLISPTDFHWGKYASSITGDGYNRTIAKERLFSTTRDVLDRVMKRGNPEKIIVAIGGDGLHIDNQQKNTTRGTAQDVDGTPVELASSYVRLCVEYIDMISKYAPVDVFVVAGNHDYYTTAILREAIRAWFRTVENVKIDEEITVRHTFLYGDSLITLMHGDCGSSKDFPAIIAGESPEIWGKSKQRFIFTGHLHTERQLPTFGNITVYRMPSLAGTDDWHWQKGYKSRKALIGYILDKSKGVIATEISPC